jgi:hypothetical protein
MLDRVVHAVRAGRIGRALSRAGKIFRVCQRWLRLAGLAAEVFDKKTARHLWINRLCGQWVAGPEVC